jgi:hypothetical protein
MRLAERSKSRGAQRLCFGLRAGGAWEEFTCHVLLTLEDYESVTAVLLLFRGRVIDVLVAHYPYLLASQYAV